MINPALTQESLNMFYDEEYRVLYDGGMQSHKKMFDERYQRGSLIYEFIQEEYGFSKIQNVLEIGTGDGGILKAIQDREKTVHCVGIDLGNEYIAYGKSQGLEL